MTWTQEDGAKTLDTRTYINVRSERNDKDEVVETSFRFPAQEGDAGAKKTVIKNKDGSIRRELYELRFAELKDVFIESLSFYTTEKDGLSFTSMLIGIKSKTGKEATLSLPMKSAYADDMMKKLPALDFTKPITLSPYNFKGDNDKMITGFSIHQDGKKVLSHFNTYDQDGKRTNEVKHGFPLPSKDMDEVNKMKDERRKLFWQGYFGETRIFLQEYNEEHVIPKLPKKDGREKLDKVEYPEEEVEGEIDF
jgi:hypothetical protein